MYFSKAWSRRRLLWMTTKGFYAFDSRWHTDTAWFQQSQGYCVWVTKISLRGSGSVSRVTYVDDGCPCLTLTGSQLVERVEREPSRRGMLCMIRNGVIQLRFAVIWWDSRYRYTRGCSRTEATRNGQWLVSTSRVRWRWQERRESWVWTSVIQVTWKPWLPDCVVWDSGECRRWEGTGTFWWMTLRGFDLNRSLSNPTMTRALRQPNMVLT